MTPVDPAYHPWPHPMRSAGVARATMNRYGTPRDDLLTWIASGTLPRDLAPRAHAWLTSP